ncbi:MAG: Nre family DNA repair protein [Candidatus Aenigmatarchaeota archaeon]
MRFSGQGLCARCKGRGWCGKDRCPLLVKFYIQQRTQPMLGKDIDGSSPPGVFCGSFGYPKIFIGPLVPPVHGDTTMLDTPEMWTGKSIEEIAEFRFQLVRGKRVVDVKSPGMIDIGKNVANERLITDVRELALADNPSDIEAHFIKKPAGRIALHSEVQPFGPSAPIKKMDISSLKIDRKIDRAYSDTDLKARDAVLELYKKGILISKIQKSFSVGAFGMGKRRRFVPTRWSITAVDSTIGAALMENTKTCPIMNEYRIYETVNLDNRWVVLMLPREWCYELIEAWYPNTIWNPKGNRIEIFSDHEFYDGRTEYAEIGGCYYAARLAVNELLNKERRQAGVVIMREAHSGYIMPVGVWNVRQSVRAALKEKPLKFATLKEALEHIGKKMDISVETWIRQSAVLRDTMHQRKITDFVRT